LWEAEFKGRLTKLVEDISRQPSVWAVAWLFLAAFSQAYNENCVQKTEQKGLKNLQFGQKSLCTVRTKEGMVSEEISPTFKKPRTLHWDYRKDTLEASQKLVTLHHHRLKGLRE
jgi:hypothetical protein